MIRGSSTYRNQALCDREQQVYKALAKQRPLTGGATNKLQAQRCFCSMFFFLIFWITLCMLNINSVNSCTWMCDVKILFDLNCGLKVSVLVCIQGNKVLS